MSRQTEGKYIHCFGDGCACKRVQIHASHAGDTDGSSAVCEGYTSLPQLSHVECVNTQIRLSHVIHIVLDTYEAHDTYDNIYLYVYMYMYMYMSMAMSMYMRMYVCMYRHIYMYRCSCIQCGLLVLLYTNRCICIQYFRATHTMQGR